MQWIKCSDRLPEPGEKVKFKGSFPFELQGLFEKSENGYEFLAVNEKLKKIYHIYGVTHWMRILPKVE